MSDVGTIRWEDGKFFFETLDGHCRPTVRPHGWCSESSEKRILAALKRKGYKPDEGTPQFWGNGIGYSMYVVPEAGATDDDDWKSVFGDTLAEVFAGIKALPDLNLAAES